MALFLYFFGGIVFLEGIRKLHQERRLARFKRSLEERHKLPKDAD